MLKQSSFSIASNINRITYLFKDIFRKGFFHPLSANFIIGFLGFGSQILVTRFLSPIELGQKNEAINYWSYYNFNWLWFELGSFETLFRKKAHGRKSF